MYKPIEIDINDDRTYRLVASLVDQPNFIRDIVKARKIVGVKDLISIGEVRGWRGKQTKFANSAERLVVVKRALKTFGDDGMNENGDVPSEHLHLAEGHDSVAEEIASVLEHKYKRVGMWAVVFYSIVCGVVDEDVMRELVFEESMLRYHDQMPDKPTFGRGADVTRRNRGWYWRNKSNAHGYRVIGQDNGEDWEMIREAIKSYKRLIGDNS